MKNTNIFESETGVLNVAPIKLSGQYKIVVDSKGKLFLDDYNSKRVEIDKSTSFLTQVGKFLNSPRYSPKNEYLKYGGFSSSTQNSYHIPLYLNNDSPNYFVLTRVKNETLTDIDSLYEFNDIVTLIDLESVGLKGIFEEIQNVNEYPLLLNWEENYYNIFGYSIIDLVSKDLKLSLDDNQSNQPYLNVLNNQVLNNFVKNDLIYPKFINLEFEFNYDNKKPFNNFYGFLSDGKNIDIDSFDKKKTIVTIKKFNNKTIEFSQQRLKETIQLHEYIDIVGTSNIININNQSAQIRLKMNKISAEDKFTILDSENELYFEYTVLPEDIKNTFKETLKTICLKATQKSQRFLLFTESNNIITVKSNIEDDFIEEFSIVPNRSFTLIDNKQKNFVSIQENDVALALDANFDIVNQYKQLLINNLFYEIVKIFVFNGNIILRLDKKPNINYSVFAEIYTKKVSKLLLLEPINFLTVGDDLKAIEQYDITSFVTDLKHKFVDEQEDLIYKAIAETAINKFESKNTSFDKLPYVTKDIELTDHVINNNLLENEENILTMMFNSAGSTSYITPNIFNIDISFYEKNGNPDFNLLANDSLCYHWFLIKSTKPYYATGVLENRYFTDKPKITSKLYLNGTVSLGQNFCETIFLGVKYRLPQKYQGYQFAVYLNYTNPDDSNVSYEFIINKNTKTLYLQINKYFDFIDLIKGGVDENDPIIDLGFLYSVTESYNTNSENISGFKSGGILLTDNKIQTLFDDVLTNDWRIYDPKSNKWYICLKRSPDVITSSFDEIFPQSGDIDFYVYSSVVYNGVKYTYVSMTFTIKNIRFLRGDFVWCEDLQVKFFDTETIFIKKYGFTGEEIFQIDKQDISSSIDASGEAFGDYQRIITIVTGPTLQTFKVINYDKVISFKESFFELTKKISYSQDSAFPKETTTGSFVFPESDFALLTQQELFTKFEAGSFDNTTYDSKIDLFDRNQIWQLIADILVIDIKFKFATESQIKNTINELLIAQLKEYSDLKSIPIKNANDEFIKMSVIANDFNLVIWDLPTGHNVAKINRYSGPYFPYLKYVENELKFQRVNDGKFVNIYDKDFGGENISATGLWKEITGNIVSSLFTKSNDIIIDKNFDIEFDVRELLKIDLDINDIIINNKNEIYIDKINSNIDEYIIDTYIDWLLLNKYYLAYVKNELNQKIEFSNDSKNNYLIHFQPLNTYQTRFNSLQFYFKRK